MIICRNVELMLPIVFRASSLHSLILTDISSTLNTYTLNLLSDNSNLKELYVAFIKFDDCEQLAAALHNNTSLTLILSVDFSDCKPVDFVPIIIKLLQSNHTLQELRVFRMSKVYRNVDPMVQLVEVAANSTSLKKLSCDMDDYEQLLSRVPKQYQHILHKKNRTFDDWDFCI